MPLIRYQGGLLRAPDGGLAGSTDCCCFEGCGCDNLPGTVYATVTNLCGTVSFPLSRVADGSACSPRYEGDGTISCRLDAYTPCGQPVDIHVIWCVGMPCSINYRLGSPFNEEGTDSFQLSSCDPVYGLKQFGGGGPCGQGASLDIEISE